MNTPSNVMIESPPRLEAMTPVEISPARRLYWSVRRELWENRSIYLAPPAVAALFLAAFFVGLIGLPDRVRAAAALGLAQQHAAIERPYVIAAIMLMGVEMVVAVFYSLDALYGERRIAASCSGSRCRSRTSPPCSPRRAFRSWCSR